ncbi:ATP-binding protein [Vibrio cholerae]|uniref:AAA family ATPase n=1 Tax=Vibrio cholerae TaxID=666 RepID=UPI000B4962A2|nr:AAA family ATPase [Vibrio cholerae]EGR2468624.1 ATP-binding protein [Vibrio cholerae]ELY5181624.1 ATP-binding protein [Vibrio cholerae]KAA1201339.1 ATP-binding protein [Vibrio cholerae]TYW40824.1 ATP-binding protein [Vibrio cholerae]TYW48347.1 ATP-binding protein [Vibrio cholerae]
MITKFAVKNFRGFQDWTIFNLTTDKKYEFNEGAISDNVVKHSMIYGENGEGKTNLGMAMLEIISHLSQRKVKYPTFNVSYLNADSDSELAEFQYEMILNGILVSYEYGKNDSAEIIYETLHIAGNKVLSWDKRINNKAYVALSGTSSLNLELSENVTSLISYVLHNSSLKEDPVNSTFIAFSEFINGMVFFKTMSSVNEFAGAFPSKYKSLSEQIIKDYGVEELEKFLHNSGITCKLDTYDSVDGNKIALVSKNRKLDFFSVASSGTFALVILFVWIKKMEDNEISFAYIDEFDAFYHHKLAKKISKTLTSTSAQTILSTHNTSIMSNNILRPDCYFEIKNQKITPLYKLSDREIRKAHNLEKMYRSGAFDE